MSVRACDSQTDVNMKTRRQSLVWEQLSQKPAEAPPVTLGCFRDVSRRCAQDILVMPSYIRHVYLYA